MKRIVLQLCAVLGLPLLCLAQIKETYQVSGLLSKYQNSKQPVKVFLSTGFDEAKGAIVEDSCLLKNGRFSFSGNSKESFYSWIRIVHPGTGEDHHYNDQRNLWVEGKVVLAAKDSIKHAVITASPINKIADLYSSVVDPISARCSEIFWKRKKSTDSAYNAEVLTPQLRYAYWQIDSVNRAFIVRYPESTFSAELLSRLSASLKSKKNRNDLAKTEIAELEKLYQSLSPEVRSTTRAYNTMQEIQALKAAGVGDPVIHFTQAGIDGELVDTRKLQGKIYLIDFWGSWCIWCRKGHPHLKELYQQYKDKGFEIIAVSHETGSKQEQETKWRKAVKEDGISWLHVLDDKAKHNLVAAYSVSAFPTKLLVDRDGTILLRVTDDEERKLDAKLAEIFNQ